MLTMPLMLIFAARYVFADVAGTLRYADALLFAADTRHAAPFRVSAATSL